MLKTEISINSIRNMGIKRTDARIKRPLQGWEWVEGTRECFDINLAYNTNLTFFFLSQFTYLFIFNIT